MVVRFAFIFARLLSINNRFGEPRPDWVISWNINTMQVWNVPVNMKFAEAVLKRCTLTLF